MEQHRLASADLNSQNLRVADEANRVATLITSLSTDAHAADAATVVLKGLREIDDLAAWAFVSEVEPATVRVLPT